MRAVAPRNRPSQQKPEVYRTPGKVSDLAYEMFNSLAHRAALVPGTASYACRMCREESFTRAELIEIRDILIGAEPESEISARILGGDETLAWIDSILN
jgi:hypothetical protein